MAWQGLPTLPTSFSSSSCATTRTSLYWWMHRAKMWWRVAIGRDSSTNRFFSHT